MYFSIHSELNVRLSISTLKVLGCGWVGGIMAKKYQKCNNQFDCDGKKTVSFKFAHTSVHLQPPSPCSLVAVRVRSRLKKSTDADIHIQLYIYPRPGRVQKSTNYKEVLVEYTQPQALIVHAHAILCE